MLTRPADVCRVAEDLGTDESYWGVELIMDNYQKRWTHPSVKVFAEQADPIDVMKSRARQTVFDAVENGWGGPPYDPFELAEFLHIGISPNDDLLDARIVPIGIDRFHIEFNPNRPHGRIRYSIAHEIAHTLFPDCADTIRNRMDVGQASDDEWQLELLCNIGAAELLMPSGNIDLEDEPIAIDNILRLRRNFDVSTEAILLRMVKLTKHACAIFAAARITDSNDTSGFRVDYSIPSRNWAVPIPSGFEVGPRSVMSECTAVGFTAKGTEAWLDHTPKFKVECVGIPPFPNNRFPRVVGVLTFNTETSHPGNRIEELIGNALMPRGSGERIIAHIVNDATPNWGAGFALEVKKRWTHVQEDFRHWVEKDRQNLSLGKSYRSYAEDSLSVVHMIAQRGYGPSDIPRIRYSALINTLEELAQLALQQGASVHMPRIGSGQAGGSWELIRELIDETLARRGIPVYIYTLPDSIPPQIQGMLKL